MLIGKKSQKGLSHYSNLLLSVICLGVIGSCQSRESLLVIRATDAPTLQTEAFDSVTNVEKLDEKILTKASHLYLGTPVTDLGFLQRLDAGAMLQDDGCLRGGGDVPVKLVEDLRQAAFNQRPDISEGRESRLIDFGKCQPRGFHLVRHCRFPLVFERRCPALLLRF